MCIEPEDIDGLMMQSFAEAIEVEDEIRRRVRDNPQMSEEEKEAICDEFGLVCTDDLEEYRD